MENEDQGYETFTRCNQSLDDGVAKIKLKKLNHQTRFF